MELRGRHYFACLWPGLPELWFRGQWSALPAALAFACTLNFLLVARFLYPEWLAPLLVKIACWIAMAAWVYSVFGAMRRLPRLIAPRTACDQPDRFAEAHVEYLQGHWLRAEALLSDCLSIETRDPPAMILLAGVYRHTDRLDAAAALLEQLEKMDAAAGWWLEIQDERRRLDRYREAAEATGEEVDDAAENEAGEEAAEAAGEEVAEAAGEEVAEAAGEADRSAEFERSSPTVAAGMPAGDAVESKSANYKVQASAADQAFAADLADPGASFSPQDRAA